MSVLLLYLCLVPALKIKATDNTRERGLEQFCREAAPMELSPEATRFVRSRPVIECAQCGERIYIPEWSECVDGCRVRHLWQCDACGTSFETTVRFAA
jgi:hypothetical protein